MTTNTAARHYYTVGDERFEADAYVAARTAASNHRQSLVHHWQGPLGPCQDNEPADYPVLRETETRPVGRLADRRRWHPGPPALVRETRFGAAGPRGVPARFDVRFR